MNTKNSIQLMSGGQPGIAFQPHFAPVYRERLLWLAERRKEEAIRLSQLGFWLIGVHGINPETGRCTCGGTGYKNRVTGQWVQCSGAGKHTSGNKATILRSPEEVSSFFKSHPFHNFGILHGVSNNPEYVTLCVDFDTDKHADAWEKFHQAFPGTHFTSHHFSPSGGIHLFFKVSKKDFPEIDGDSIKGLDVDMLKKLDVLGVDLLYGSGRTGYSIGPYSVGYKSFYADGSLHPYAVGARIESFPSLPDVIGSLSSLIRDSLEKRMSSVDAEESFKFSSPMSLNNLSVEERKKLALEWATSPLRARAVTRRGGQSVMYKAATVISVGFALSVEDALEAISAWNSRNALPEFLLSDIIKALRTTLSRAVDNGSSSMGFALPKKEEAKKEVQKKDSRNSSPNDVRGFLHWNLVTQGREVTTEDLRSQFTPYAVKVGMKKFKLMVGNLVAHGAIMTKKRKARGVYIYKFTQPARWEEPQIVSQKRTTNGRITVKELEPRVREFILELKKSNPKGWYRTPIGLYESYLSWDSQRTLTPSETAFGRAMRALVTEGTVDKVINDGRSRYRWLPQEAYTSQPTVDITDSI